MYRIRSFLSYWLNAVDEHSLHSPFFFDLYTTIIKSPPSQPGYTAIESLRRKLTHDHRTIKVQDFGTGAAKGSARKISSIARTSLTPARFSRIYAGIARQFKSRAIIELGTSFGINTLYLADDKQATVTTFEGAPAIADIATITFEFAGKNNIELIVGNIDKTLPTYLQRVRKIDLAFIDANHRYEPTVRYFDYLLSKVHEQSVVIVDDIHHSAGMEKAWNEIKHHRLVYASADLFRCGIAFFDPSLNKQHVVLQL